MIERYGLFDSVENDEREYAESDFALLVRSLGFDGVRGAQDALKVSAAASGLRVRVAEGAALVQGRYYALEADGGGEKLLALEAAVSYPRIDRIVLTLDYAQRMVQLGVLRGGEAASPVPPALVRSATQHMLSLAQVRVEPGASTLRDENITDERADETLCGLHVRSVSDAIREIDSKAPAAHASSAQTYGLGTASLYGHVRLSDAVNTDSRAAGGTAATPYAAKLSYDKAESAYQLAKAKQSVDKVTGTLYANGWTDSAPYTQAVSWAGFVASDLPVMDLRTENMTAENAANLLQAYALVDRVEVVSSECRVYCYRGKPAVDLPVRFMVFRAG